MENFLKRLSKLTPEEFIGLARFLNVPLLNAENEPREFHELLKDILDIYESLPRRKRRTLLLLLPKL